MPVKFSEFDAKKQEMNCGVNVNPIIHHMYDLLGQKKTSSLISGLGIPMSFLLKKTNWVSYEYYKALLELAIEATGDPQAPFKAAFSMKPKSTFEDLGYITFVTLLASPPITAYKFSFSKILYTRFTKIGDFEILSSTSNSITVRYKLKEGYKQDKNNCLAIQGFMSALTTAWGIPPAEVEHRTCAADGEDSCLYKIHWQKYSKLPRSI